MSVASFFTKEDKDKIVQAIKDAEKETSGEIRLHLDLRCTGEALDMAVKMFEKLKMHETQLRNGTLIYLAVKDHKFAIFGDEGINEIVPNNFWEDVKEEIMLKLLRLKFKIPKMRRMLLDTGHQELEEGNYWHDNEWGNCYCMKCLTIPGKNKLGKLLMKIRDELLTEDVQAVPEKLELEEAKRIIDESLDPEFYRKEIVDDNS